MRSCRLLILSVEPGVQFCELHFLYPKESIGRSVRRHSLMSPERALELKIHMFDRMKSIEALVKQKPAPPFPISNPIPASLDSKDEQIREYNKILERVKAEIIECRKQQRDELMVHNNKLSELDHEHSRRLVNLHIGRVEDSLRTLPGTQQTTTDVVGVTSSTSSSGAVESGNDIVDGSDLKALLRKTQEMLIMVCLFFSIFPFYSCCLHCV